MTLKDPTKPARVLALDISSRSGWALLEGVLRVRTGERLIETGCYELEHTVRSYGGFIYPWSMLNAARNMAEHLAGVCSRLNPDVIVIEETNMGRNRYSQKYLEQTHGYLLKLLEKYVGERYARHDGMPVSVVYVSTSAWRKTLQIWLTKEQKAVNSKLSRAKSKAKSSGTKLDKKALGIKGKTGWKHLAVARANEMFGLNLQQKHNDIADAIMLGLAYIRGADTCDGT